MPDPVIVDFETEAIEDGSPIPPNPIGVAILYPGQEPCYYSWGHVEGNNTTWEGGKEAILAAWSHPDGICCHNLGFDVSVAEHWFQAPRLPSAQYHDTQILAFLLHPEAAAQGLKDLAKVYLGMPPEEQAAVAEYLIANQKRINIPVADPEKAVSKSKKSDNYFAKYMRYAPADLVGRYAVGDVVRTLKLFQLFYNEIAITLEEDNFLLEIKDKKEEELGFIQKYKRYCIYKKTGMQKAYIRELKTALILTEMRYTGMRVDMQPLEKDKCSVENELGKLHAWFEEFFGVRKINLDAPQKVIQALIDMGLIQEKDVPLTKTGKMSGETKMLLSLLPNSLFSAMYAYWSKLNTFYTFFILPWYQQAIRNKGIVYTSWSSVRNYKDKKSVGAITGRITSSPNFQNIPKKISNIFFKSEEYPEKPAYPFEGIPVIPNIRAYIIPFEEGHTLVDADYSQQEIRILAHFEEGDLFRQFKNDPNVDIHKFVAALILERSEMSVVRDIAKKLSFTILYGGGAPRISQELSISWESAKSLRNAYFTAVPGVAKINNMLEDRAYSKNPFYTLGGRRYYAIRDPGGGYKTHLMLNYLIQGSAADMSKQALIDFYEMKDKRTKIILTVHDQFLISCPWEIAQQEAEKLILCMSQQKCNVVLIIDCKVGKKTWAECKE